MLAVCAGICYGLLGINFLTLIPLLGKRDEFGLIHVSVRETANVRARAI